MNRAILAGSVIVGIGVMMSISMIAPAFAANPWKDVFICDSSDPEDTLGGTYQWVEDNGGDQHNECDGEEIVRAFCFTKRDTPGHMEFKDRPTYGEQTSNEQTRCHKDSFWTDTIPFVVPVV